MRILGIETSCDETAIAIIDVIGSPKKPRIRILANVVASQVKLHEKFGGVVPNLARREHQRNLVSVLLMALRKTKLARHPEEVKRPIDPRDPSLALRMTAVGRILEREPDLFARLAEALAKRARIRERLFLLKTPKIDAIAVTVGPGLAPALWVGVNFARALAYLWGKPLIAVNHMEGHLYSALFQPAGINPKHEARNYKQMTRSVILSVAKDLRGFLRRFTPQDDRVAVSLGLRISDLRFPALALLVSGGHTELVLVKAHGKFKVIGETLDDAAGEAFDKVAKMLGLGFPGGPIISKLAERGNPRAFNFPRPMMRSKDFNFSFSGLKTAVLYKIREKLRNKEIGKLSTGRHNKFLNFLVSDFCASFEQAVTDVLTSKTIRAAKEYRVKTVMIGGGVAANIKLRHELGTALQKALPGTRYLAPDIRLTGDNALMIALAGWFSLKGRASGFSRKKKTAWRAIQADANLRLG